MMIGIGIVSIEKTDDIAACQGQSFVHRIVHTAVGFRFYDGNLVHVFSDEVHRSVRRATINNNMFHEWIGLRSNGKDSILDCRRAIADNRNNRNFHRFVVSNTIIRTEYGAGVRYRRPEVYSRATDPEDGRY